MTHCWSATPITKNRKQRLDPLILDNRVRLWCKRVSTNPSCLIPAAHVGQGVGRFSLDTSGPSEKKTEPRCVLLAKVDLLEYTVYKMDTVTWP